MLSPSSAGTPEERVTPSQRPAAWEMSNKCSPIMSVPISPQAQDNCPNSHWLLHFSSSLSVAISLFEQRWEGGNRKGQYPSVLTRVFCSFPVGRWVGNNTCRSAFGQRNQSNLTAQKKTFKFSLEKNSTLQILTHYNLKFYFGNHASF